MHYWGDDFKHFRDVEEVAYKIGKFCRRYGRICVMQTKEKYGTARVYCSFDLSDLHGLIWPGYAYVRYKKLYKLLTFRLFKYVPTLWWQKRVYREAYKRALKKYPHIREEILCCADFPEHLEGL